MKLDSVQITDFRNLSNISISPSTSLNFIFGKNGSGKSSVLEAIHHFGFGRSFRTSKHKRVIKYDAKGFNVFCTTSQSSDENGHASHTKLGMFRGMDDSLIVSINGEKSNRMSEFVGFIPMQIFTPQSSDLIIGSPNLRRRFLDWGLFHVEHSYVNQVNSYQKLVKNKNALLKKSFNGNQETLSEQMRFWDQEIVRIGESIDKYRLDYLDAIKAQLNANLAHFLPEFSFEISYYRGWEKECHFEEAIVRKYERDIKNGYLSVGPHKADLKILTQGVDVSESLSRGQLRMLVAALQLAQIQHLCEVTNKTCVFLLDDVGAELDETKRELFIDKLLESKTQLFITAIEQVQLPFMQKYKNKKVFHVEHGRMREEN